MSRRAKKISLFFVILLVCMAVLITVFSEKKESVDSQLGLHSESFGLYSTLNDKGEGSQDLSSLSAEEEVFFTSHEEGYSFTPKQRLLTTVTTKLNSYTVVFDGNGGTIETQDVPPIIGEDGEDGEFRAPLFEKEGYDLSWSADLHDISRDIVISAIWEKKMFSVSFNGGDGTFVSGKLHQVVEYGEDATPPVFEKPGFTLFWDSAFTQITKDTVINAIWESNSYSVSFVMNGGFLLEGSLLQTVKHGEGALAPILQKDGYELSWDISFSCVTENIVVNAVWTQRRLAALDLLLETQNKDEFLETWITLEEPITGLVFEDKDLLRRFLENASSIFLDLENEPFNELLSFFDSLEDLSCSNLNDAESIILNPPSVRPLSVSQIMQEIDYNESLYENKNYLFKEDLVASDLLKYSKQIEFKNIHFLKEFVEKSNDSFALLMFSNFVCLLFVGFSFSLKKVF